MKLINKKIQVPLLHSDKQSYWHLASKVYCPSFTWQTDRQLAIVFLLLHFCHKKTISWPDRQTEN